MCMFSGNVVDVANTRIFARDAKQNNQFLVYEMTFTAAEDLAMILPIPVPPSALSPKMPSNSSILRSIPRFLRT